MQSKYLLSFLVDAWRIFPNDLKIKLSTVISTHATDPLIFFAV